MCFTDNIAGGKTSVSKPITSKPLDYICSFCGLAWSSKPIMCTCGSIIDSKTLSFNDFWFFIPILIFVFIRLCLGRRNASRLNFRWITNLFKIVSRTYSYEFQEVSAKNIVNKSMIDNIIVTILCHLFSPSHLKILQQQEMKFDFCRRSSRRY